MLKATEAAANTEAAWWHLELLGRYQLRPHIQDGDGKKIDTEEITIKRRQARLLLAYLALHPNGASRRKLCGLFGGRENDDNVFSVELSTLRRCFKPLGKAVIVCQGGNIRLNFKLAAVDVQAFEALFARAELEPDLRKALALRLRAMRLYQRGGLLLPDEHDTDWINARRAELETAYQQACLRTAQEYARRGKTARASRLARALAARAPRNAAYKHLADALAIQPESPASLASTRPASPDPPPITTAPPDTPLAACCALPTAHRRLFQSLCVFEGAFTLEAVCALHQARAKADRPDHEAALTELLDALLLAGVVNRAGPEADALFVVPALLRALGAEELGSADRDSLSRRLARYHCDLAHRFNGATVSVHHPVYMAHIGREYAGFCQTLRWLLEQADPSAGATIVRFLTPYWLAIHQGRDAWRWVYRCRKRRAALTFEAQNDLLHVASSLAMRQGRISPSAACCRRSLALCQTEENMRFIAGANIMMGQATHHRANDDKALNCFNESLRLYQTLGCRKGEAVALRHIGMTLLLVNARVDDAQRYYEDAIKIFDTLPCLESRAATRYSLSEALRIRGDYPNAAANLNQSLALFQNQEDRVGIAQCIAALGTLCVEQGQFALARHLLEDSCARLVGQDRFSHAAALGQLAEAYLGQGELDTAQNLLERGCAVWQKSAHPRWMAWFQVRLSQVAYYRERHADALQWAALGLENYALSPAPLGRANGLYAQANALQGLGRAEEALACLQDCLLLRHAADNKRGVAQTLEAMAGIALTGRDWRRAAQCLGKADALRQAIAAPVFPVEEKKHSESLRAIKSWKQWHEAWTQGRHADMLPPHSSVGVLSACAL